MRPSFHMNSDCRDFAAVFLTAVYNWRRFHGRAHLPQHLIEMRRELDFRLRAAKIWREHRKQAGTAYGLSRNWYYPRLGVQRRDHTMNEYNRRQTPTGRAAHLGSCARWNDANREFRRAADRLYRQERRRRERQGAGLPPHKTHLTPPQRAAERKRLAAERAWWRKEHAVIERERDEKQRRIKAERGGARLLHR